MEGPTAGNDDLIGLIFAHRFGDSNLVMALDLVIGRVTTTTLHARFASPAACQVALNDVVILDGLRLVAMDAATWVLEVADGVDVSQIATETPAPAIRLTPGDGRWIISSAETVPRIPLGESVDELIADRIAEVQQVVTRVVSPSHSQRRDLAGKCVSVIRVNTMSAEGPMQGPWTTPDRIPHRDMWLWDTAWHSIGLNHLDPERSWETISTLLKAASPDGMIPLCVSLTDPPPELSQPPILAWAIRRNALARHHRHGNDDLPAGHEDAALKASLAPLRGYLDWFARARTDPQTGLARWWQSDDPLCRAGESGMDNSVRFDLRTAYDVDLSVYLALDLMEYSWICRQLGLEDEAHTAASRSQRMSAAIHERLWDESQGFYVDLRPDGSFSRVRAVSGFLPLLLDDLPNDRLAALLTALDDPGDFGTPWPVPSISLSDPNHSTDMWRGPSWINVNYLLVSGLVRRGHGDRARVFAKSIIDLVERWYRVYGVLFEFYPSRGEVTPPAALRKGTPLTAYAPHRRIDNIRDYHWTAALTLDLLSDRGVLGCPPDGAALFTE